MKCPKCGTENKDGAKFCIECGIKFKIKCPPCGRSVPLSAKFGDECGSQIAKPSEAPSSAQPAQVPRCLAEKILASRSALEGEGKQAVTIE